MDVKIRNYIDTDLQTKQKQAIENAKRQEQLDQFKAVLSDAVNEISTRINQQANTATPSATTGNSATVNSNATAATSNQGQASEQAGTDSLGCPSMYESFFEDAAKTYQVDVNLLKAVAKQESAFTSNAVSKSGAVGIMQLMPGTAATLGVENSYDPYQNIMGGAKFLSQLLEKYQGDTSLALAAYNAGPGAVDQYNGIPPYEETQNYVRIITDNYQKAKLYSASGNQNVAGNTSVNNSTGSTPQAGSSNVTASNMSIEQMLAELQRYIDLANSKS